MVNQLPPEQIDAELASLFESVDAFAVAMKAKLANMVREENRTGWNDPANADGYYKKLLAHAAGVNLAVGEEVDIANFAMFLWRQRMPSRINREKRPLYPNRVIATIDGNAGYSRDGETLWEQTSAGEKDDFPEVGDVERMASADPNHDWRIFFRTPTFEMEYRRHCPGCWVLVRDVVGSAVEEKS